MPSFRVSSQPRDQIRSPTLQVDSLPFEPPRKPDNRRLHVVGAEEIQEMSLLSCKLGCECKTGLKNCL